MKKLLTLVLALVIAFSAFGLVACENNAGDVTDGACQHSVGVDGVCTICGKDILAKWKTVFDDAEKYKGFSEEEYTMKITSNGYSYVNGVKQESTYINIYKNEKNKIYQKSYGLNAGGSIEDDSNREEYYENLPDESKIMEYDYTRYWNGIFHVEYRWVKSVYDYNDSYSTTLAEFELFYGPYMYIGTFESMVPTKIEYEDEVFYVYYSIYGGMQEFVIAVKNDLIIEINGTATVGDETETVKIEISYDDVNLVLPEDAILVD